MDGATSTADPYTAYTERLRRLEAERKVARAKALELKREIKKESKRKKTLFTKTKCFSAAELYAAARKAESAENGGEPP